MAGELLNRLGVADGTILSRLGEEVTVTPDGGEVVAVVGILDVQYAEHQMASPAVEGNIPVFTCRDADAANLVGGTLAARGVTYAVKEAHPDGTGMTDLFLERS